MSFSNFGGGGSSSSGSSTSATKQAIMQQVQQEAAMSNARQLVSSINSNCYDKCVTKPGTSLSSSEEGCLGACMEKYMAAWNTTAKTYTGRLSQERQQQQSLGGGLLS